MIIIISSSNLRVVIIIMIIIIKDTSLPNYDDNICSRLSLYAQEVGPRRGPRHEQRDRCL